MNNKDLLQIIGNIRINHFQRNLLYIIGGISLIEFFVLIRLKKKIAENDLEYQMLQNKFSELNLNSEKKLADQELIIDQQSFQIQSLNNTIEKIAQFNNNKKESLGAI